MKKYLILAVLLFSFVLVGRAHATTPQIYYVSDSQGNDANCTGLSQTAYTSGTAQPCPWKTTANVNAGTFNPGDSVLFKRGDTFRGQKITVPSSGQEGNPITFSAYGSGANPLLNGSALLDKGDFTEYTLGGGIISSNNTVTPVDTADIRNYRQVIPAASITGGATSIQIRLTASAIGNWHIGGASIGEQSSGGTTMATPVRIKWDGGSDSTIIGPGQYKDSDPISFSIAPGHTYLVHVFMTDRHFKQSSSGDIYYVGDGYPDDQTTVTALANSSLLSNYGNIVTAIISGDGQTIYKIPQDADPVVVWENSLFLAEKGSVSEVASPGSWYWDGDDLFVNASDGGNIIASSSVYETRDQVYGIFDNANNYLDISNIDSTKTFGSANTDLISGVYLTGSHNLVHDLEVSNTHRHNFCFYVGSDNNTAYNLTLHDDISTTPVCIYAAGTTDNTLRDSNIYNAQANTINDGLIIFHGGAYNNIVEHNDLHIDNGASMQMINVLNEPTPGDPGNIIRQNHFYGNGRFAILAFNGGNNGIFSNNLIDARNFTGDGNSFFPQGVSGWEVFGNTVLSNNASLSSVRLYNSASDLIFKNNLFYSRYPILAPADSQSGLVSDNNLFYHPTSLKWTWGSADKATFDLWKSASSQDANSTSTDPLFVNASSNFTLQPFSPAIDAGTTTGITAYTEDYAGNPIYGTPDIGAYEYQPPYTTANPVATSSVVRIYGNGKWRPLTATTTSGTADLAITVAGSDTTKSLDLTIPTWTTASKYWTETSSTIGPATTAHTVGDLTPGSYYTVKYDKGSASTTVATLEADDSGQITFNYTGGYSTANFSVEEDVANPNAPTLTLPTAGYSTTNTAITFTWEAATASSTIIKYALYINNAVSQDNISSATLSATKTLACGTYTWYVAATAGNGTTANSALRNLTVACPSGASGYVVRRAAVSTPSPSAPNSPLPTSISRPVFTAPLHFGLTNSNVKTLQIFLNTHGFTIATAGVGAPGHETNYFGNLTRQALGRFQLQNKLVTSPNDIAFGFLGPKTRALINSAFSL